MAVIPEILEWSRERPLWQQDALRRLVEQPALTGQDLIDLVRLCKREQEIHINCPAAQPLSVAGEEASTVAPLIVRLRRVHSVRSVNALRDDQELLIAPAGLTIVFGDNGSGKSGYVRVLKQVCRVRGAKDAVHPNVYAEEALPASAKVCYEEEGVGTAANAGGEAAGGVIAVEKEATWGPGNATPPELAQVSVFDSRSAAVYITDENEVAYLPLGTDLFPKLVGALEKVKDALESEIITLDGARDRFESIPGGTSASEVLDNLHVANARERFDALARISEADQVELEHLRLEDRRLKTSDPLGRARELRRCVTRLAAVRDRAATTRAQLEQSTVDELRALHEQSITAREAAELASTKAFVDAPLGGVGTDTWRALWQAARRFAEDGAVPVQEFPPPPGARSYCVLCQQALEATAHSRMQRFEEFVHGETRAQADNAVRALNEQLAALGALAPGAIADQAMVSEVESLEPGLGVALVDHMASLTSRRDTAVAAARRQHKHNDWTLISSVATTAPDRLDALIGRRTDEAALFEAGADAESQKAVEQQLRALEARVALSTVRDRAYAEIERQQLKSKLKKCVASTNTTAVTKKSVDVLRGAVSEPLAAAFMDEVKALDLAYLPVAVEASHGEKGRAFHTLALGTLPAKDVPAQEVFSEGEHRGVALAAFLAEISLQESASTVVLDDPVSSMDHGRRGYVAKRIVGIASRRPVLVFTHDLVFLWMLQGVSAAHGVELVPRLFRRDASGTGIVSSEWPWDGQNVSTRIGVLKQTLQAFPKLAANDRKKYETEVRTFYGRLRDTWERAVEEVLLNSAVRRFQAEVQTLRLKNLHRITEQQMQDFEAGMTKSSAWIQGHDHATALALPVPEPAEAVSDLEALERWVKELKKQNEMK